MAQQILNTLREEMQENEWKLPSPNFSWAKPGFLNPSTSKELEYN